MYKSTKMTMFLEDSKLQRIETTKKTAIASAIAVFFENRVKKLVASTVFSEVIVKKKLK